MPTPKRKRWSKRAKWIWGINTALAAGLLGIGGHHVYHERKTKPIPIERNELFIERARTPVQEKPHSFSFPREPLHFSQIPKGNYCMMYARLAAEKLFGKKFNPGDAWDAAHRNRSVWRGETTHANDIHAIVKPGQIIGMYNPGSKYNSRGREYTHTALYIGFSEGKHWIMQRIGTNDRLESLEQFLHDHSGWEIIEIIDVK